MDAMLQIYDSSVDPALEVRRITIAVCEIEDESFADLMHTFLCVMKNASRSGGLCCDGVVSEAAKV